MALSKEERRIKIRDLLEQRGKVEVVPLADQFQVSEMTIRRDLQALELAGLLQRIHGGALWGSGLGNRPEPPVLDRMDDKAQEKRIIAREVSRRIGPKETVFIGSGTTTLYVARELIQRDDLIIVSNSLPVLELFSRESVSTTIAIGGFLRREECSFIGHIAEQAIQDLRADRVIMGMRGIHPEHGLTSDHPQELRTDRAIIRISDHVMIVADSTKFGSVVTSRTAPITAVQSIVTTKSAPESMVESIRALGIEVYCV